MRNRTRVIARAATVLMTVGLFAGAAAAPAIASSTDGCVIVRGGRFC
ncbi:hypothetical protein GCM10027160_40130 [Streptomyces calidiresistens]|uniref:Uncharacterized protein n=1 Tax=Streptomyces calidiresistens TaxID=1485586 RepID=A0A7W3T7D4_9ACTN|nr:hypothetical protein [Streptomyces calidiresistens]MBB0232293.1 hypothetical protein [Streptomyces calidiresistens]